MALPLTLGLIPGIGLLGLIGLNSIVAGDRVHTPTSAAQLLTVLVALCCGLALLQGLTILEKNSTSLVTLARGWSLQVGLAGLATLLAFAGVRFGVLGAGLGQDLDLGVFAIPLTVLWLVVAANALRLLDGLDGAAPMVLGVGALATGWFSLASEERLYASLCAVLAGSAFGCLRFHCFPQPALPLRAAGTVCFGIMFAVLTVLARQKTTAFLLLLVPLGVLMLVLGSAMLTLLERNLLPGEDDPAEATDQDPESENFSGEAK
jgi:UDP-N-acetylmuramyl pentapeptide phosphotransferase/UDP-N-acetylglucosamine-1-phosphate transferase